MIVDWNPDFEEFMKSNLQTIIRGEVDVVLYTTNTAELAHKASVALKDKFNGLKIKEQYGKEIQMGSSHMVEKTRVKKLSDLYDSGIIKKGLKVMVIDDRRVYVEVPGMFNLVEAYENSEQWTRFVDTVEIEGTKLECVSLWVHKYNGK